MAKAGREKKVKTQKGRFRKRSFVNEQNSFQKVYVIQ